MFKRIISYIFPITKKIQSKYNGYLELTVVNGKTVLDTSNANYSYGSLQKVLKFSLEHTDVIHANNVLLLGLGGGCVLRTLWDDFNYKGDVTAVDIDPVVIDVAEKEFGIVGDSKTEIICADAFDYAQNNLTKFDLIIIDLFIDNVVPEKFLQEPFWKEILKKVNPHGTIIFNTLCMPFTDIQPIEAKLKRRGFKSEVYRYVEKTNKVLIAIYI